MSFKRLMLATGMHLMLLSCVNAAEIEVVISSDFPSIIEPLAARFERSTGHTLHFQFHSSTAIKRSTAAVKPFDVAILTSLIAAELVANGYVAPDSLTNIAKFEMGVAVQKGASQPDISTPAALWRTLVRARSIAYARDHLSGMRFITMIGRYGLTLEPKCLGVEDPLDFVARGDGELGIELVSAIRVTEGVASLGPLPKPFETAITMTTGVARATELMGPVQELIAFFRSPAGVETIEGKGIYLQP